jgi:hypothetical protein
MRRIAVALALALAVACGGAASRGIDLATPSPSEATASPGVITPAGSASATAGIVVGTIQPIVPGASTPPPPTPSPTPSPAPGGLTQAQLKYRLIDSFGALMFCDPDYYPVARADEQAQADQRFPEIQKDAPTFSAILAHLRIPAAASYTAEQRLAIYRDWKMLNALRLESVGGGFRFNAIFEGSPSPSAGKQGSRVDGTIDQRGNITVVSRTPSGPPPCPICLARGTRIATPAGEVPVETLRAGDVVWTLDASGARVAAPLVAVGSTPVPATHQVVRLRLDDGRTVEVSPGHPTADGRVVGDLSTGDGFDGALVSAAARIPYGGGATFDILPAGTGVYFANGVLLGSTLR